MFDVAWTDPSSETVGQRRRRKEREASSGASSHRPKSSNSGASSSTTTTENSARAGGWNFFGGVSNKKTLSGKLKGKDKRDASRSKTPSVSALVTPPTHIEPTIETAPDAEKEEVITRIIKNFPDNYQESRQSVATTCPSTPAESVFSGPTYRSSKTESSWDDSISEAPSKAYSTVYTPSHARNSFRQEDASTLNHLLGATHISGLDEEDGDEFTLTDSSQFPRVPSHSSVLQAKNRKLPRRPTSPAPIHRALPELPRPENKAMRQRVRRMEAASSKIILERLREEWDHVTDAAMYHELEFEKQLWMLVGLRYLIRYEQAKRAGDTAESPTLPPSETIKALSLYENQACASHLSTQPPLGARTHHLSLNPPSSLDQASFLRTLIVTTPVANLPYGPSSFKIINCLRLSILLPCSSIPTLLSECHRILSSRGVLNLTIMDPTPRASTLGPKLKAWMEDHLLLKLETQFRCLKPAKLMPIWLEDAGFRLSTVGKGSPASRTSSNSNNNNNNNNNTTTLSPLPRTTNHSFRAVARGEGGYGTGAAKSDRKRGELEILASTVGRMLWREIYGPFVAGKHWWWEDEEIIEEMVELGTKWDFSIVEAVKQV